MTRRRTRSYPIHSGSHWASGLLYCLMVVAIVSIAWIIRRQISHEGPIVTHRESSGSMSEQSAKTVIAMPDPVVVPEQVSPSHDRVSRLFPRVLSTREVTVLATTDGVDLARVADMVGVASRVCRQLLQGGAVAGPEEPDLCVAICDVEKLVTQVHEALRLPPMPSYMSAMNPSGFYVHERRTIVIGPRSRSPLGTVAHEAAHAVIESLVPGCPDALNEGFADVVTELCLAERNELRSYVVRRRDSRRQALSLLMKYRSVPSLGTFCSLDRRGFRDRNVSFHFQLAWCLAEAILELDRKSEVPRLPAMWRSMAAGEGPVVTIDSLYGVGAVQARWRDVVARCADG